MWLLAWGLEVRSMRTLVFNMLSLKGRQFINIEPIKLARLKLRETFKTKDIDQGVIPKA